MSREAAAGPRTGGSRRPGADGPCGQDPGCATRAAEEDVACGQGAGSTDCLRLHGTCVAVAGRGLLLRGPSGVGKSRLALHLMALGARLVADDMVELTLHHGPEGVRLIAGCPPAGRGLIEARGLGLLAAAPAGPVPLAHVVDLGGLPGPRLPPRESVTLLRQSVPLHRAAPGLESAGALMQLMRAGRHA